MDRQMIQSNCCDVSLSGLTSHTARGIGLDQVPTIAWASDSKRPNQQNHWDSDCYDEDLKW